MLFSRDYRRPFWRGLSHAILVVLYVIFISLIYLTVTPLFQHVGGLLIEVVFGLFVTVLTVAICGYFIFFEPLKKMLHHHFKAGTVMLASTLGWLFIFLVVFVMGYVFTLQVY